MNKNDKIEQSFEIHMEQKSMLTIKNVLKSSDQSKKFIFSLSDGLSVESVYIPQEEEIMLCLSSQVGCSNKCRHCATGQVPYKRDLTTEEIVGQFLNIKGKEQFDKKVRIIFMGMGEPLFNFKNVFSAIETFVKECDVSHSDITVSTSGILSKFRDFAGIKKRPRLAISLHAADNEKRSSLMPINKIYSIDDLMSGIWNYINFTSDQIIIEYTLIGDFNDLEEDRENLLKLLFPLKDKIELQFIPLNESKYIPFKASEKIEEFKSFFLKEGFQTFIKQSSGRDIGAGCGQLVANLEIQ